MCWLTCRDSLAAGGQDVAVHLVQRGLNLTEQVRQSRHGLVHVVVGLPADAVKRTANRKRLRLLHTLVRLVQRIHRRLRLTLQIRQRARHFPSIRGYGACHREALPPSMSSVVPNRENITPRTGKARDLCYTRAIQPMVAVARPPPSSSCSIRLIFPPCAGSSASGSNTYVLVNLVPTWNCGLLSPASIASTSGIRPSNGVAPPENLGAEDVDTQELPWLKAKKTTAPPPVAASAYSEFGVTEY